LNEREWSNDTTSNPQRRLAIARPVAGDREADSSFARCRSERGVGKLVLSGPQYTEGTRTREG